MYLALIEQSEQRFTPADRMQLQWKCRTATDDVFNHQRF